MRRRSTPPHKELSMSRTLVLRRFPAYSAVIPVSLDLETLAQRLPDTLAEFVGDLHEIYRCRIDIPQARFSIHTSSAARLPNLSRTISGTIVQSAGGVNLHVHVCDTPFWRLAHSLLLLLTAGGLGLALILPGFFLVPGVFGILLVLSVALMWLEARRFIGVLEEALP